MRIREIGDILNPKQTFFEQMKIQARQLRQRSTSGSLVFSPKIQLQQYEERRKTIADEREAIIKRYDEQISLLNKEISRLKTEIEAPEVRTPDR